MQFKGMSEVVMTTIGSMTGTMTVKKKTAYMLGSDKRRKGYEAVQEDEDGFCEERVPVEYSMFHVIRVVLNCIVVTIFINPTFSCSLHRYVLVETILSALFIPHRPLQLYLRSCTWKYMRVINEAVEAVYGLLSGLSVVWLIVGLHGIRGGMCGDDGILGVAVANIVLGFSLLLHDFGLFDITFVDLNNVNPFITIRRLRSLLLLTLNVLFITVSIYSPPSSYYDFGCKSIIISYTGIFTSCVLQLALSIIVEYQYSTTLMEAWNVVAATECLWILYGQWSVFTSTQCKVDHPALVLLVKAETIAAFLIPVIYQISLFYFI
ncbi:hypothetical protein BC829DRAFT_381096 [Chytridium lagenaria]|nr:hypothetical protein BC829DRAFT_381096 [Chytridium lagenaria]